MVHRVVQLHVLILDRCFNAVEEGGLTRVRNPEKHDVNVLYPKSSVHLRDFIVLD